MQTRSLLGGAVIGSLLGVAAFSEPALIQTPAVSSKEPADRQSGVIRGQVFAAEGERPLVRARVTLYSTGRRGDPVTRTVRTDSRGEYEIRNLEEGKYILRASRNGYLSRSYSREKPSQSGRRRGSLPLSLAPGQVLDGIDFPLIQGGVVEGTVVDPYNEPRSQVSVTLSEYRSYGGERELVPAGHAKTDDRGRFRLFDIRPGSYYLSAVPRPLDDREEEADRSFPPVYYPGVLNPREAAKVEVAAGQEVGGFYFTLIEVRSYGISGRVLTPEGRPAHSVWIRSRRESDEFLVSGMEPSVDTDRQGEFKVKGLLPGRHRLTARSERDEDLRMASAVVEVTDQDIEGLTLVLAAGAEITGRIVTDREEADLDWRRISLYMESIGSAWRYAGGRSSRVEEDFTFKIKDLQEASYRLVVRLPPRGNHYVESIRIRTEELTDRPIEVRSGDRLDGVEIHVSSEGAQISGVVEKEEGREVAQAATVLVFAADSEYRGPHSRFTRRARTDQRGQFTLKGLVPAQYLVCAFTDHEYGLESNLDYLSSLERDAERIDLSQGQRLKKNLVALPAPRVY
ncbi:MAG: carboxypeptidase-like regulatory domain-containing protein [Acidobacteriota bacterium]|nr:carboxypeptidase-like regulatory domain-containing protein [Acidobacteriota bacterium]